MKINFDGNGLKDIPPLFSAYRLILIFELNFHARLNRAPTTQEKNGFAMSYQL
jgi:hypothetical protein